MPIAYILKVPCSLCGKIREVKLKGYCSGSCKVKAFRLKEPVVEQEYSLHIPSQILQRKVPTKGPEEVEIVEKRVSDTKRQGYHFSSMLNTWVKD